MTQAAIASSSFKAPASGDALPTRAVNIIDADKSMLPETITIDIPTAEFTARFGRAAPREAKWLFIAGTLGSGFLTWAVGFFSKNFGSLRVGVFFVFFAAF